MANNTYVALDKVTIVTATPSITFSSISGAYTDLIIVPRFTPTSDGMDAYLTFNGDTTSGLYSKTHLAGFGTSSTGSTRFTGQNRIASYWQVGPGNTQPTQLNYSIMNYSNSTTFKTILGRAGSFQTGASEVNSFVGLWRNTNPITSITLSASTGNFAVGSTFELYGILAEGVSPTTKATGGAVYSDNVYYYHVFGSSGIFTPTQSITADVLVVAGGGGSGCYYSGAGGAGGFRTFTSQTIGTAQTVTIGAGGAGVNEATPNKGNNSAFGSLAATGGGQGNCWSQDTGRGQGLGYPGGSGGGASLNFQAGGAGNQGGYSPVEGYAAGAGGKTGGNETTGGGGGAGAVGGNAGNGTNGGNGGNGLSTAISGGATTGTGELSNGVYYFAGGGGGGSNAASGVAGSAGIGGGGVGGKGNGAGGGTVGANGLPNTGGGAGGSARESGLTGGSGGSGIVIVRYAK